MSDELKPCPNLECPKSSPVVDRDCGYDECVYCASCGASTGWYKGYALPNGRAIVAWNTRSATATFKNHQILAEKIASASHDYGSIAWCAAYDAAKQVADLQKGVLICLKNF